MGARPSFYVLLDVGGRSLRHLHERVSFSNQARRGEVRHDRRDDPHALLVATLYDEFNRTSKFSIDHEPKTAMYSGPLGGLMGLISSIRSSTGELPLLRGRLLAVSCRVVTRRISHPTNPIHFATALRFFFPGALAGRRGFVRSGRSARLISPQSRRCCPASLVLTMIHNGSIPVPRSC